MPISRRSVLPLPSCIIYHYCRKALAHFQSSLNNLEIYFLPLQLEYIVCAYLSCCYFRLLLCKDTTNSLVFSPGITVFEHMILFHSLNIILFNPFLLSIITYASVYSCPAIIPQYTPVTENSIISASDSHVTLQLTEIISLSLKGFTHS